LTGTYRSGCVAQFRVPVAVAVGRPCGSWAAGVGLDRTVTRDRRVSAPGNQGAWTMVGSSGVVHGAVGTNPLTASVPLVCRPVLAATRREGAERESGIRRRSYCLPEAQQRFGAALMRAAVALFLLGAAGVAQGQGESGASQRWSVLPALGYTTETAVFIGGMAVRYLPQPAGSRGSSVPAVAIASIQGQYQAFIAPDLYSNRNRWHVQGRAALRRWPAHAYPRGNESPDDPLAYESDGFDVEMRLERCVTGAVSLGPTAHVGWEDIRWRGVRGAVPGAGGGRHVGVGGAAAYDTRDNANEAHAGTYITTSAAAYRTALGSDASFQTCTVQARHYLRLAERTSLALAGDLQMVGGHPPFTQWSTPDGVCLLRGIENGRYRDSHLLSLQAECRQALRGPWGARAFADAAQVAARLRSLAPGDLHWALGAGLRYALNPTQRYNLRLDAAWVNGGPGFVFSGGEAF
jgi:hypothetical protein